jgi:hypothetical protein
MEGTINKWHELPPTNIMPPTEFGGLNPKVYAYVYNDVCII